MFFKLGFLPVILPRVSQGVNSSKYYAILPLMITLEYLKKLNLPSGPGVYFFRKNSSQMIQSRDQNSANQSTKFSNNLSDILYIGKATSLRERVRSYFNNDLIKTRGRLLVDMMAQADSITFQETDSVLEAFILESELIKQYQPYYNTKEKDNKSFNYVVITKDDFPRVLVVRGRNLEKAGMTAKEQRENLGFEYTDVFGPFPFGTELREAMKLIRRIFPYRDKCEPFILMPKALGKEESSMRISTDGAHITSMIKKGKPCFNRSLGLCPGVCTGEISKEEYNEQIQNIRLFFKGKKQAVLDHLKIQMHNFAKRQKFEEAGEVKKTIQSLNHIQDISMIKKDAQFGHAGQTGRMGGKSHAGGAGKKSGENSNSGSNFEVRAEAYDIAHLSGKDMVGVMVVMEDGEFARHEYKKFNIREIKASNDTGALKQVLERRLNHAEWPVPTHIVIDGGIAQLNAAEEILKNFSKNEIDTETGHAVNNIILVAVTKDDKHKAKEILRSNVFKGNVAGRVEKSADSGEGDVVFDDGDIISLNQECHRFAIATHRKRRSLSRGL